MDNISHPGAHIKAWLAANQKSQAYLASAIGYQEPFASKLVNGHAHITPKIAIRLEAVTQIPATTWMHHETEYMIARARLRLPSRLSIARN